MANRVPSYPKDKLLRHGPLRQSALLTKTPAFLHFWMPCTSQVTVNRG